MLIKTSSLENTDFTILMATWLKDTDEGRPGLQLVD